LVFSLCQWLEEVRPETRVIPETRETTVPVGALARQGLLGMPEAPVTRETVGLRETRALAVLAVMLAQAVQGVGQRPSTQL